VIVTDMVKSTQLATFIAIRTLCPRLLFTARRRAILGRLGTTLIDDGLQGQVGFDRR
jgi:hypothetical protein